MQTELTPTIAEMSEVVAKYIGKNVPEKISRWGGKPITIYKKPSDVINWNNITVNYLDWNRLHEVWEKVRDEEMTPDNINTYKELDIFRQRVKNCLYNNSLNGCFIALFETIKFINQLKV